LNRFQVVKNPLLFVEHGCTILNSEATEHTPMDS
jgi:hypothetical protein